jgi:hypothetical protein
MVERDWIRWYCLQRNGSHLSQRTRCNPCCDRRQGGCDTCRICVWIWNLACHYALQRCWFPSAAVVPKCHVYGIKAGQVCIEIPEIHKVFSRQPACAYSLKPPKEHPRVKITWMRLSDSFVRVNLRGHAAFNIPLSIMRPANIAGSNLQLRCEPVPMGMGDGWVAPSPYQQRSSERHSRPRAYSIQLMRAEFRGGSDRFRMLTLQHCKHLTVHVQQNQTT